MDFGDALKAVIKGNRVYRRGWSGRGMWVCLIKPGNATHLGYDRQECLGLKTANSVMQPGWVPSQADMLADDWEIRH